MDRLASTRAQSVISEIVTHLERQGLLERENDPADRRRTLIWLSATLSMIWTLTHRKPA